jgi:hypothetical protein
MEFSIEEMSAILKECEDEADIVTALQQKKVQIDQSVRQDRDVAAILDRIIAKEKEAQRLMEQSAFVVETKSLAPMLIAGIRMTGKYSDCGKGFARIARALGRHIVGRCFCLYYDDEYREKDADCEACFPLRRESRAEGVSVRTLPWRSDSFPCPKRPLRAVGPLLCENPSSSQGAKAGNPTSGTRSVSQRAGHDFQRHSRRAAPSRNNLSHANKRRPATMAEKLFWGGGQSTG